MLRKNPKATVRVAGADTNTGPDGTSMWHEMQRRIDPTVQDRFIFLGELPQDAPARGDPCVPLSGHSQHCGEFCEHRNGRFRGGANGYLWRKHGAG